jgi:hypothetical protein
VKLATRLSTLTASAVLVAVASSLGAVAFSLRHDLTAKLEEELRRGALVVRETLDHRREVLNVGAGTLASAAWLESAHDSEAVDGPTLSGIADEQRQTLGADLLVFARETGGSGSSPPGTGGTRTASSPSPTGPT